MMSFFIGKKIILTGAGSGIGYHLLERLLNEGSFVLAVVKQDSDLTLKHDHLYKFVCDLSMPESIDELFEYAVEVFGEIDIFIANAGFAYYEHIGDANWNHIENIFSTNTMGIIYSLTKLKAIKGDKPFQFITTSSTMSLVPLPGYALYSATKAAITGFSKAYRYELKKGQKLQVVYPIATKTNFFKNAGKSPTPFPVQSVEYVAKVIVKGIKTGKKNIFPSKLFRIMYFLNKFFPFLLNMYVKTQDKKLKKWLGGKND